MERIRDIQEAKDKVLQDMNAFISGVRDLSAEDITDLGMGLSKLRNIRSSVYENLNQIQHEYLILQGLIWVTENKDIPDCTEWYWNPRQTGDSSEPDLRGIYEGKVIISAEATTSEKPQGVIDSRMRDTLIKLNEMNGDRFYFIRTTSMETRAKTKIKKHSHHISVVKLEN